MSCAFSCGSATQPSSSIPDTQRPSGGKGDFFGDDVPFADLYFSTSIEDRVWLRGRLVEEDVEDIGAPTSALGQISQDEMKNQAFEVRILDRDNKEHSLGKRKTNDEGYFDDVFDISALGLQPGRYLVTVYVDNEKAGETKTLLLDDLREKVIVRSDVDLTYLSTDFHSTSAILKLLKQSSDEKNALVGMPTLYQSLRGDDEVPITFLSGSPKFFKRVLEGKMVIDRVEQDGLVLKPLKDISKKNILGLSWGDLLPDLKEQVGYKLFWLLKLRTMVPNTSPEILMGDDSEADYVVYNIYYRFLKGELTSSTLEAELDKVKVSTFWKNKIQEIGSSIEVGKVALPQAIYINKTDVPGETFDIKNWIIPGITRHHKGAYPLALDMAEENWITTEEVLNIRATMIAEGVSAQELDESLKNADFLNL